MTLSNYKIRAFDIIDKALKACKRYGADEASVSVGGGKSGLTRFAGNHIIQNVESDKHILSLAVSLEGREAGLKTSVLNDEAIDHAAQEVVKMASMYPINPEHVSPIKPIDIPESHSYEDETANYSQIEKAEKIRQICQKTLAKKLLAFGTLTSGWNYEALGNSNGHRCWHPASMADFSVTVRTEKGDGSCRENRSSTRIREIDFDRLVDQCCDWAQWSTQADYIEPGDYKVILTPTASMNYLVNILFAMDARKVAEGRSALSNYYQSTDLIGKQLFSPLVSISSRKQHPEIPSATYGSAFDLDFGGQSMASGLFARGLPIEDYPIIEQGKLKHLFSSLYWAQKNNLEPKAFPSLIEFKGTDKSTEQLIAETDNAILINSFWYIRFVDPNKLLITGLTRDGIFLVQNGKIQKPLKNMRFNESPIFSLENVEKVGKPELRRAWFYDLLIPSMVINNFSFTSETAAV